MQKLLNSPDSYTTFKTHLEERCLKMTSDSNFICRSSGDTNAKKWAKCDCNCSYLHFKTLENFQDFFKPLFDFNHTKITLWTLYVPIFPDHSLKSVSKVTKSHQYGSFHALLTPITPNLYSVLASKLQFTIIISRSSSWSLA